METRVAIIGIILENRDSAQKLNDLLHEYSDCIIGRMGLPYPKINKHNKHSNRCNTRYH